MGTRLIESYCATIVCVTSMYNHAFVRLGAKASMRQMFGITCCFHGQNSVATRPVCLWSSWSLTVAIRSAKAKLDSRRFFVRSCARMNSIYKILLSGDSVFRQGDVLYVMCFESLRRQAFGVNKWDAEESSVGGEPLPHTVPQLLGQPATQFRWLRFCYQCSLVVHVFIQHIVLKCAQTHTHVCLSAHIIVMPLTFLLFWSAWIQSKEKWRKLGARRLLSMQCGARQGQGQATF